MKLNGRPRWTVISAAAAAITIGAAGTALAGNSGADGSLPLAIQLQERVPVVAESAGPGTAPAFSVIPSRVLSADDSFNTTGTGQFASADGTFDSPGDSPNTFSLSPDDSPAGNDVTVTADSIDSPDVTATTGAVIADDTVNSIDSPDSPDSVASMDATDSPDSTS